MCIGSNPEKFKLQKLIHKPHRVIIPVNIPNLEEEYFKNVLQVLKICIDSLLATTNSEQTNITVINNNSCVEVDMILNTYFDNKKIQKYIKLSKNRGKVEPILAKAKASYEDFIIITNADVFFNARWLEESIKLFRIFEAGVVIPTPMSNVYYRHNMMYVNKSFLTGNLKIESIVSKDDMIRFEKGIEVDGIFEQYYNKQFVIQKDDIYACLGAGLFVATYDRQLFEFVKTRNKVEYVFKNDQGKDYLDNLTERGMPIEYNKVLCLSYGKYCA